MRTWPASTKAAALVRAFTTRACHNHLSRRWRSNRHPHKRVETKNRAGLFLAAGGELLLERGQFRKWRIRIDRAIALARCRAGRPLPMRRPAVALVATAVTAAFVARTAIAILVAIALVAVTAEFFRAATLLAILVLAFKALARRAVAAVMTLLLGLPLARLGRRRALGGRCCGDFRRSTLSGFAEFIVAMTPPA